MTIGGAAYTITEIGDCAFCDPGSRKGCENLASLDLSRCIFLKTIGAGAFNSCTNLKSVDFSGCIFLKTIGEQAFNGCTSLTTVALPYVSYIGYYAFADCSNLQTVTILAIYPPSLGSNAFGGCHDSMTITVPAGSVNDYSGANNWSDYTNTITGKSLFLTPVSASWSGQYGSDFASKTFTITNVTGSDVTVSVTLGDNAGSFTLNNTPTTVAANGTATFTVTPNA